MNNIPIDILIVGSCVSRDIFNFNEASSFNVVDYFARSSFASIYGKIVNDRTCIEKIRSPFQKKIVLSDLNKHFVEEIGTIDFDLLLVDFIDERLDLFLFEDGSICTLSNELVSTGFLDQNLGRIILSGSDEFLDLWKVAWSSFVEHMKLLKNFDRVRLHKTYWCYEDIACQNYDDTYKPLKIKRANDFLDKLYEIAQKDLGDKQIIANEVKIIGAVNHKWGRSPFNYIDQYYIDISKHLSLSYTAKDYCTKKQKFYDPYALHKSVHRYKSLKEAIAIGMNKNGIHNIFINNEQYLDICIQGLELLEKKDIEYRFLLVGFSGAVSNRKEKRAPFFSGLGIASKLNLPIISIADATLALNEELSLAWYAGNEKYKKLPQQIAELLDTIAKVLNVKLLLFGGSGGGFAALTQATLLNSNAIVYVWNPQTEIGKYVPEFVNQYDSVAFSETKISNINKEHYFSNELIHNLCNEKINPNIKLLYMQNQNDWHMIKHALPYMEKMDLKKTGNATYINEKDNYAFFFGLWGDGHAIPPEYVIQYVINSLVQADDVLSVATNLDKGIETVIDTAPPFLKLDSNNDDFPYEVSVEIVLDKIIVYCEMHVEDQIKYAFYLLINGKKIEHSWYSQSNVYEFNLPDKYEKLEIMYFIKDLFGTIKTTRYVISNNF